MFDLTSSKLLILGVVALIVVGPKELPFLLRTIGKYVAMIRRQATEFRAQFDEAMREAELEGIKKDLESVARDTETTIRSAQSSVETDVHAATTEIDRSVHAAPSAAGEFEHPAEATTAGGTAGEAAHVAPIADVHVPDSGISISHEAPVVDVPVASAVPHDLTPRDVAVRDLASRDVAQDLAKTGT